MHKTLLAGCEIPSCCVGPGSSETSYLPQDGDLDLEVDYTHTVGSGSGFTDPMQQRQGRRTSGGGGRAPSAKVFGPFESTDAHFQDPSYYKQMQQPRQYQNGPSPSVPMTAPRYQQQQYGPSAVVSPPKDQDYSPTSFRTNPHQRHQPQPRQFADQSNYRGHSAANVVSPPSCQHQQQYAPQANRRGPGMQQSGPPNVYTDASQQYPLNNVSTAMRQVNNRGKNANMGHVNRRPAIIPDDVSANSAATSDDEEENEDWNNAEAEWAASTGATGKSYSNPLYQQQQQLRQNMPITTKNNIIQSSFQQQKPSSATMAMRSASNGTRTSVNTCHTEDDSLFNTVASPAISDYNDSLFTDEHVSISQEDDNVFFVESSNNVTFTNGVDGAANKINNNVRFASPGTQQHYQYNAEVNAATNDLSHQVRYTLDNSGGRDVVASSRGQQQQPQQSNQQQPSMLQSYRQTSERTSGYDTDNSSIGDAEVAANAISTSVPAGRNNVISNPNGYQPQSQPNFTRELTQQQQLLQSKSQPTRKNKVSFDETPHGILRNRIHQYHHDSQTSLSIGTDTLQDEESESATESEYSTESDTLNGADESHYSSSRSLDTSKYTLDSGVSSMDGDNTVEEVLKDFFFIGKGGAAKKRKKKKKSSKKKSGSSALSSKKSNRYMITEKETGTNDRPDDGTYKDYVVNLDKRNKATENTNRQAKVRNVKKESSMSDISTDDFTQPSSSMARESALVTIVSADSEEEGVVTPIAKGKSLKQSHLDQQGQHFVTAAAALGAAAATTANSEKIASQPSKALEACYDDESRTVDTLENDDQTLGDDTHTLGSVSAITTGTRKTEFTHGTSASNDNTLHDAMKMVEEPFNMIHGWLCSGLDNMSIMCGLNSKSPPKSVVIDTSSCTGITSQDGTIGAANVNHEDPFITWKKWLEEATPDGYGTNCGGIQAEKKAVQSKEPVAEPELPTVEEAPTSVSIVEEEEQEEIGSDGLMQLVRFAARTKHDTSGAVFDEAYNVDVVTDVRFLFITTSLPLGALFKENGGGCYVGRVFAGSASALKTAEGEMLEVCDQLATINGASASNKTVAEVCSMMSASADPKRIELSFLRYTGPLRLAPLQSSPEKPKRAQALTLMGFSPIRQDAFPEKKKKTIPIQKEKIDTLIEQAPIPTVQRLTETKEVVTTPPLHPGVSTAPPVQKMKPSPVRRLFSPSPITNKIREEKDEVVSVSSAKQESVIGQSQGVQQHQTVNSFHDTVPSDRKAAPALPQAPQALKKKSKLSFQAIKLFRPKKKKDKNGKKKSGMAEL